MELDDRKVKILTAIIKNYLDTGEPVGSRTISKFTDLKLSSATIRNEMSDLEEMGYIIQPHTSAGRIPSDMGYRFYVDSIIANGVGAGEQEYNHLDLMMVRRMDRVEQVLKTMARMLATDTNYAAMISGPQVHKNKLKFIQLTNIGEGRLLAVIVLEGNLIKNRMIDIGEGLSDTELLNLNILLNSSLNGLALEEINLPLMMQLKKQAGNCRDVVDMVLSEVAEVLKPDKETEVYTSGATNIFKYPELADGERASQLIDTLEQKDALQEWINENAEMRNTGIQVYIGDETRMKSMQDCSVVTANYELEEGVRGVVGIIGPKRMDYEKVLGTLRSLLKQLDITYHGEER